jgi:hypothetical protein
MMSPRDSDVPKGVMCGDVTAMLVASGGRMYTCHISSYCLFTVCNHVGMPVDFSNDFLGTFAPPRSTPEDPISHRSLKPYGAGYSFGLLLKASMVGFTFTSLFNLALYYILSA